jgi:hypothetical protein
LVIVAVWSAPDAPRAAQYGTLHWTYSVVRTRDRRLFFVVVNVPALSTS